MYRQHFGFREQPFSIAPDPYYLYLSPQHQEALGHLVYGVQTGGFILLTGEVGTGKTTVCRRLLSTLPEQVLVAYLVNPGYGELQLLEAICDEFRIPRTPGSGSKELVDAINFFLLDAHADGRNPVLIIDEAQTLAPEVLERIRLLTNLETTKCKLLQIILIGQPELRDMLASHRLRQLNQRITGRFHLEPLNRSDVHEYVAYRTQRAGVSRPLFSRRALDLVFRYSRGIPRLVNMICDRALLGAWCQDKDTVSPQVVKKAAREVLGPDTVRRTSRWWMVLPAFLLMLGLAWALSGLDLADWTNWPPATFLSGGEAQ
ncbi:MAG: AAA family ATPase [Deltaproteobacteria bacterium]|nr:MAG: AAA family ATPase [Deltaproteobacteria bacterium]